jgi:histidyl-tRNA synthetase
MFSGENVPACGFSLGFERMLVVMTERKMFPSGLETAAADVMLTLFDEEGIPDALALAAELRRGGLRVDVYPEPDKLGKQFKYAASRGVGCVTVIGSDERAKGVVTVKDMQTGQQTQVPRADIARWLASSIEGTAAAKA